MKIAFIISSLGYGGASKMMAFVANSLAQLTSNEVYILVYENNNIIQPINKNINLILMKKIHTQKVIRRFQQLFSVYKHIKIIRPDILISFLNFPNLYAIIIGNYLKIPVIISERGDPYQRKGTKDKFFDIAYNWADGAVFQTDTAKEYFNKKIQSKSVVIPNPVLHNRSNKTYNNNISNHEIIFIGRFELKQKRQDIMLYAFAEVLKHYPDARLKFYGTGKDEIKIKELAHKLSIYEKVFFMGYTSNINEVLLESEVYVLTSDYEGIPNTLIEAMALGMPVIATDCSPGGARLLVQNNKNGIIVNKGDYKAIANGIVKVFSSPEFKLSISQNALSITDTYSEDIISSMWIEYINKIYERHAD